MSSFNRVSHLATFGDYGLFPAGQRVFTSGPKGGVRVMAGQPVLYNPRTGIALAAGDVATAEHVTFAVGVGKPNQVADTLRYLGGEKLDLCTSTLKAKASAPVCAIPQVVDIFFDSTKMGKQFSIQVDLDDSLIRAGYDFNGTAKYFFSVGTEADCESCDASYNCEQVACKLVDQINGRYSSDVTKLTRFVFKNKVKDFEYQPFRAARLFNSANSIQKWCLQPAGGECNGCTELPAITGITVGTGPGAETFNFEDTYTGSVTYTGQLDRLIANIRQVLDANHGYAGLSKSIGECCPFCLEISSCVPVTLLGAGGTPILPTEQENPFSPISLEAACRGCGVDPGTANPTCGIRFYIDPVTVDCLCDLPPNDIPKNYYGRTIQVYPIGDGWSDCNGFFKKETQRQVLPRNFGYWYQHKARFDSIGGRGRDYRLSNRTVGRLIGLPDKYSRDSNVAVDCKKSYCVYSVESTIQNKLFFNNAGIAINTSLTNILIPASDTVTQVAVEGVINALQARMLCAPGVVACGVRGGGDGEGEGEGGGVI